ncbi:MAG: hypothetical protein Q7V88_03135 [Actinomycetota bacterium]|nr:hypothetical protein [Actinomycetota bacterium]
MNRRTVVAVSVALASLAVFASCSDDEAGGATGTTLPGGSTLAPGDTVRPTLGPTTTFIVDCAQMPAVADLSATAGIPLDVGQVVSAGSCQYLGLNDQSRVLTLSLFTDPGDQAAFTDLQASLGAGTPLNDPTLPGAVLGVDNGLYLVANGGIYVVYTSVNDSPPADQALISAAILRLWLPQ